MRRVLSLALLLVLVGSSIRPVAAGPTADLRLLEQRVAALEARITALEARPWPTTTTTPTPITSATPSASPSPAPSATPVPTPTPSPSPTVPAPTSSPTGSVPFGSRPTSAAISLRNCADVTIENLTLRDLGAGVITIRIEGCTNVTIRAVDFDNVAEGVYVLNSTNITVVDSRYRNITGPAQPRTGANVANFVQFNNVQGGLIARNKGKGGDTEDIVSVYQSSNVVVEDNHFEGTNWTSGSGSGIALSDGGGSGNIARRNILVNPGQVGAFIAGGTNSQIVDNIVIGEARPKSNVGVYVWNQSSSTCSGHTVSGNRVRWLRADGVSNPYWNAGDCGTVAGSGNVWGDSTLDIERYRVSL